MAGEKCPTCHGPAEEGCIYAPDRAMHGLVWRAGPPTFGGNVAAALLRGESVGDWSLAAGAHAVALRCRACRLYFLPYDPAPGEDSSTREVHGP